jgi:hypothetical protein
MKGREDVLLPTLDGRIYLYLTPGLRFGDEFEGLNSASGEEISTDFPAHSERSDDRLLFDESHKILKALLGLLRRN